MKTHQHSHARSALFATLASAALLFTTQQASATPFQQGWFGLNFAIEVESLFNPTVKSMTILTVRPQSPGAERHVAPGDQIIDVEDHAIEGSSTRSLQILMRKAPGESLHLRLKRPNGDTYTATLIAVTRPTSL